MFGKVYSGGTFSLFLCPLHPFLMYVSLLSRIWLNWFLNSGVRVSEMIDVIDLRGFPPGQRLYHLGYVTCIDLLLCSLYLYFIISRILIGGIKN